MFGITKKDVCKMLHRFGACAVSGWTKVPFMT